MSSKLLKRLEVTRNHAFKRLNDALMCARGCLDNPATVPRFSTWLSRLDSLLDTFTNAQLEYVCQLHSCGETEEMIEMESQMQSNADDVYAEIKEIESKVVINTPPQPQSSSSAPSQPGLQQNNKGRKNAKLPEIKLPIFNGQLKEFTSFIDLYDRLVHFQEDLSNVEKFQYLITSLSAEPRGVLRSYPITEQNYEAAYNALRNRYCNKRYLAFLCWEEITNFKPLSAGTAPYLRKLLDTFDENISILETLGLPTSGWDFVLFHSMLTKLDKRTREAFELSNKKAEFPKFEEIKTYLSERCAALERSSLNPSDQETNHKKNISTTPQSKPRIQPYTLLTSQGSSCQLCNENHALYMCPVFKSKTPQERYQIVRQYNLCPNCLRGNHSSINCTSTYKCRLCNKKHNSLLHFPTKPLHDKQATQKVNNNNLHQNQPNSNQASSSNSSKNAYSQDSAVTPVTSLSNVVPTSSHFVLLATAEVEIKNRFGTFEKVRVLIDPGSQANLISERCVKRLGITRYKSDVVMSGIGDMPAQSSGKVLLEIRPTGSLKSVFHTEALILNKICADMPTQPIDPNQFNHLSNVTLADNQYHVSRPVDVLIGGELFPQLLLPGKIQGSMDLATAINTVFGWILMGKTVSSQPSTLTTTISVNHVCIDENLNDTVQKFWAVENVIEANKVLSSEDLQCEEIYNNTHERDHSGRYCVKLPFKVSPEPQFSGSYNKALSRFLQLERRFKNDQSFYQEYKNHITEYLTEGQLEEVSPNDCKSSVAYYIPHHPVFKASSSTHLRVVYNASAKDNNNLSLNDTLFVGCKLQADIVSILLRFRLHPIVFACDIRQMYRQILVHPDHRDFQRILFRFSFDEPIREFRMGRVTFGVSSAPFLAIRTIHQLAEDEQESYPQAADILRTDIYVDDVVTGCQDTQEALVLQKQLINIMNAGGFQLRKWASNDASVLKNVQEEHRATPNLTFDNDSNVIKVLGLAWNSLEDIFMYHTNPTETQFTKRSMLSELARIFDPIGFLTPITFMAKFLIQRIWLLGLSWDAVVPDDIKIIWEKYSQQLSNLSKLNINRRITYDDAIEYQIHAFCDASESGYATCIFLRCTTHDGTHHVSLVFAKSRISPIKRMTLPRLELSAASLLADAVQYVYKIYSKIINIQCIYAWSDSMIVLSWIKSPSSSFKVFVGNRISNIQRKIPTAIWSHVPSKQNPADCASRGLTPDELVNHDLWWAGPQWLSSESSEWPSNKISLTDLNIEDVNKEQRATVLSTTVSEAQVPPNLLDSYLEKCSSLTKIQRFIVYWRRFINHKFKKQNKFEPISEMELHQALLVLVKHIQKTVFKTEIENLHLNKLSKSLRKLKPFLDKNGVLRVGGRLSQSDIEYEAKHPALLPRKNRLTELIIKTIHDKHLHPGLQTLHYLILQHFWILSPKRAIRSVISQCYRCFRVKPVALQPEMADLPKARVTEVKAFQVVGCDYAGPFNITFHRYRGARTTKAYLCLFVCFATKALHLELASDLSTQSFLAALRRFIARRGRCNIIHSDCGTNFKGAQSHLASIMESACAEEKLIFKFNPPAAPHYGGLWEAGVKSVKTHIFRVIGTQILTYEELNTLLVQIESLLNSRPLCPLSSDPTDLSVLTPGHFLTLAPLTTIPDTDYTDSPINRLTRWQLLQKMHQDFWSRWHKEYLTTLTQRLKWTSGNSVEIGRVVLIKDELKSPMSWHFARIIKLHVGKDGVPRSATLKTSNGFLDRPLVKLCPIPNGCDL